MKKFLVSTIFLAFQIAFSQNNSAEIVVLNKIDSLSEDEVKEKVSALKKASKKEVIAISGIAKIGIEELKNKIYEVVNK